MRLINNFSSGPDGTTITTTNSGNGDDDAFAAAVVSGVGALLRYALSPSRESAEFVAEMSTAAASGRSVLAWAPGGSFTQIWCRFYAWYAVLPNNFTSPPLFYNESGVGGQCALIAVNSSGTSQIIIANKDNTQTSTSTWGVTAGEWFRIEAHFTFSTTVGAIECRIYGGDDVDTDNVTETITGTNWNLGAASAVNFYMGYLFFDTNLEALRMSGLEINDTGFPGPLPYKMKAVPGIQPSAIAIHNDVF